MDDGFEGIGSFDVNASPWDRYIAHQAAKGNYPPKSEAQIVREELFDDSTVDNETYGRLVEEAADADERASWEAERDEP